MGWDPHDGTGGFRRRGRGRSLSLHRVRTRAGDGPLQARTRVLSRNGLCRCFDPGRPASGGMRDTRLRPEPPVCAAVLQQPTRTDTRRRAAQRTGDVSPGSKPDGNPGGRETSVREALRRSGWRWPGRGDLAPSLQRQKCSRKCPWDTWPPLLCLPFSSALSPGWVWDPSHLS